MTWPGVSDYQEAIQAPQLCFGDPDLKAGSPVLTKLGLPRPISGGNASVYQIRSGKHEWAVRCFLRDLPDMQKRYEAIDQHLRTTKLPKVGFQYLKDGIRVRGRWVPILKMEWVRGVPLNEHIKSLLADPKALRRLAEEWAVMMRSLKKERVAHGDLQHGNVMVAKDKLVLIDYDGMYVPALHGNPSHELGHASYQHPRRQPVDFGPGMDRFSSLLVHTAILAVAVKPELWAKYDNADNLLFERGDLEEPDQSALFDTLEQLPDEDVAAQCSALRAACSEPIDQVPEIEDAVRAGKKARKRLAKQKKKQPAAPAAPNPTPTPAPAPVAAPKPAAARGPAARKRATQALGGPTPSWVSARISTPPSSFGLAQAWQYTKPSTAGQLAPPKPAGSMLLSLISLGMLGASRRRRQQALVRPGGRPSAGTGRSPAIKSLAFSLDGRLLLTGGDDRFCDLYDAKNGKQLRRLGPHSRAVTGVVAAGKDRFATCSLDGRVRVFNTKGTLLGSWPGARKTPFFAAASTPDGELLAFGMGRIVKVFANNGQHKATMRGHTGEVLAVAMTRSKQHVISGSIDHSVCIWSVGNARCEHELAGLHDAVEAVAVSDDCQLVAGSSRDGMVCIWDSKTSSMLHRIATQQHGVHALAFMPGSRTLLAAGADGVIHFIDAGNGTITGKVIGHQGAVFGLAVTADGNAIASSSADGSIIGWSQKPKSTATPKTPAPQLAGRP
ncbi:MAG TPA: WD40 repeat domain-containing serine/threonine-protein kinase [Planctomycetota bacterium]|nr:WD40 repeat domain-containing serine/threonine-protein kinase [Planctomycetota bacterium]